MRKKGYKTFKILLKKDKLSRDMQAWVFSEFKVQQFFALFLFNFTHILYIMLRMHTIMIIEFTYFM